MIVLDDAAAAERIALPEPWRWPVWASGTACHYAGAESGRVWRLDIDGGVRGRATEARLGEDEFDVVAVGGGRIVVAREVGDETRLRVLDLESGRLLHERAGGAVCLLPDGRALLALGEDSTEIAMLDAAVPPHGTRLFQCEGPLFGYEPYTATCIGRPADGDVHVVVGHYGFTVDYRLCPSGPDPAAWRLVAEPRAVAGLVLDPVDVWRQARHPWVPLCHGYGSGLQLHHVESGERLICPLPATGYGTVGADGRVVADGRLLVPAREAWHLWDHLDGTMTPLCSRLLEPLGIERGGLWALRRDDNGAIGRWLL